MDTLLGIVVRVVFMYIFVLVHVRFAGKRGIGELSAQDFVTTLILGDMFDDVFTSEIPLLQGVVAVSALVGLHVLISVGTSKSKAFDSLIGSNPVLLVQNGRFVMPGLHSQRMRPRDLGPFLRENEVDSPHEIKEARMEPVGDLSVLLKPEHRPADRRDLEGLKETLR
jgi:uncharacterized membrane protein YcaP (DUF421 family)